jgi:TRAP-type C4-dicarboxylate transport system permease small subunit
VRAALEWLERRADNVAVGLLTVMFFSFVLQIFSRYVIRHPLGWTIELCLTSWLWLVFWGCGLLLKESDHVRFDVFYVKRSLRVRRIFALVSAVAILVALIASLPDALDYITFLKIKKSAILRIRLDLVFSVYGIFAAALIARLAARTLTLVRGGAPDELGAEESK